MVSAESRCDTAIIGAGITGLAAAHRLRAAGRDVVVLDGSDAPGGVMRSTIAGGFVFEHGPTTVLSSGASLWDLVVGAGLEAAAVYSRDVAGRRLVWRGGALHELPAAPGALLRTPLLSWRGKARLLMEPWIGRGGSEDPETLGAFLARRFGAEVVDAFADPFVTGVYAGDVWQLGADAFPRLLRLEREHGSILRGLRRARRAAQPRSHGGRLFSFRGGLAELPDTLGAQLGSAMRLGCLVRALTPRDGGWTLTVEGADGGGTELKANQVILATPVHAAGVLLDGVEAGLGWALLQVPTPHVASVALGYALRSTPEAMDAFGFLCPGGEEPPGGAPVLGALFPTSIFPDRAPAGHGTVRVMLGGSRDQPAAMATDAELVQRATAAVGSALGLEAPVRSHLVRWERGIPQYMPGHLQKVQGLREDLRRWPGLHLAGNYLEGVGVESCVSTGFRAADACL